MSSSFSSNPESLPLFWGDVLQRSLPPWRRRRLGILKKAVAFRQAVIEEEYLKLSLEDPKRADDLLNNFNLRILAEAGACRGIPEWNFYDFDRRNPGKGVFQKGELSLQVQSLRKE